MKKKKTFKELFAGTEIEPTINENGGVDYNFNATLKKEQTMKTTTNPTYASYESTNLVNYLNESGTGTLSQPFISCHDFLPNTYTNFTPHNANAVAEYNEGLKNFTPNK
jgi:hypothetical protein